MSDFKDKEDDSFELSTQATVDEQPIPATRLSDDERLRMLGYDSVLGRPFNFWGSAGISCCYNPVLFEFVAYSNMYAYRAPLLFLIGYPCLVVLHLCLIGPFAEFVSTYPVAGGMATWAWQAARHGIRGERQWSWVVASTTLAMHLARIITQLYFEAGTVIMLYFGLSEKLRGATEALWAEPVLQLLLIALAAIVSLTRVGRNQYFWAIAGVYNIVMGLVWLGFLAHMAVAIKNDPVLKAQVTPNNWGFPTSSEWTHSFARMIFVGLPLRVTAMDASVHMAEETKSPSRTVPRVLLLTSLVHYTIIYVLVAMQITIVVPLTQNMFLDNPFISSDIVLKMSKAEFAVATAFMAIPNAIQIISATIVTSRFIFALARDRALPFSTLFEKTDKHKQPWVAVVTVLLSLCLSTIGWVLPSSWYPSLLTSISFYLINIPYGVPLMLYVLSHLDLRLVGRPEFSLGRFSRPLCYISIVWLSISFIQGCFPLNELNMGGPIVPDVLELPFLPIFTGCLAVVIVASWYLYGKRHYIGPIRALTIWATGTDVDPHNVASNPRGRAIKAYIERKTGRKGSSAAATPRPTVRPPRTPEAPKFSLTKSGTLQRLFSRSPSSSGNKMPSPLSSQGATHQHNGPSVLPESDVLPPESKAVTVHSVVPESGLFPETRHQAATLAAIPESDLFNDQQEYQTVSVIPESDLFNDSGYDTASVLPESAILPGSDAGVLLQRVAFGPERDRYPECDDRETTSAAQEESQIFPAPPRRTSQPGQVRSPPPPWRGTQMI
ncbi:hypothetical protein CspeluHIS016_0700120 [Cutaneotrichosporon spelunceum]|uniref:Amino acid transporter n=1 Tax=Cutaneotrichosporon spelunceum TaxID=1672016 RepID=A0AAD3TY21_9TREE|nr:hypothetical protein CspeluHIS016_0700120 [Cutaneotrichosporon spelunceum]